MRLLIAATEPRGRRNEQLLLTLTLPSLLTLQCQVGSLTTLSTDSLSSTSTPTINVSLDPLLAAHAAAQRGQPPLRAHRNESAPAPPLGHTMIVL